MCPHGKAHWRHLANTNEPTVSICGGDAVLCQITVTTCYYYDHHHHSLHFFIILPLVKGHCSTHASSA